MRITAYTYEADYHCITCTINRFHYGEYWIAPNATDNEGNLVNPLFSTDEWQEFDESFLAENPIQYLACGDCHEVIEEYHHGAL